MEKTIVIYKSKYGAAAQYAEWIAEELGCRAVSIDEFKKNDLKNYENVIYGGGVQAGGIKELDKFMKWIKSDLKLLDMYRSAKISGKTSKNPESQKGVMRFLRSESTSMTRRPDSSCATLTFRRAT